MKGWGLFLIIVSIICFIACGIFSATARDKYENYYHSDSYYSLNRNAYVGGDAYNYIINGTYFTAFAVSAVGCGVGGILFFIGGCILIALNSVLQSFNNIEINANEQSNSSDNSITDDKQSNNNENSSSLNSKPDSINRSTQREANLSSDKTNEKTYCPSCWTVQPASNMVKYCWKCGKPIISGINTPKEDTSQTVEEPIKGVTEKSSTSENQDSIYTSISDYTIRCNKCGMVQSGTRKVCYRCGISFLPGTEDVQE